MDMQSFLDELIKTSREYAEKGKELAEEQLNLNTNSDGDNREATLDGMKKGAIAAGVLALLLGTSSGRKLTGSALKIGSLAAVGGIAYKTWQNLQAKEAKAAEAVQKHRDVQQAEIVAKIEVSEAPKALSIDKLEGDAAEERSQILVKAMIAAAKSDGKMTDDETANMNQQIQKLGLGEGIEDILKAGMVTPLSAKSVARMADDQETAAEIYLVSILVTDTENAQEKSYMNALAKALALPAEVVQELESYRQ